MNQETRNYLVPALIGGVSLGVASQIPILNLLNCACCALAVGAAMLSAFLYMRDKPPVVEVPYGEGALLGIVTGVVGSVVSTLIAIPIQLFFGVIGMGGFEQLHDALEEADVPQEVLDLMSGFGAAGFSIFTLLLGFFFSLVFYAAFGAVGGLLGVALFHKKAPPGPPAPGTAESEAMGGLPHGGLPPGGMPPGGGAPPGGSPPTSS